MSTEWFAVLIFGVLFILTNAVENEHMKQTSTEKQNHTVYDKEGVKAVLPDALLDKGEGIFDLDSASNDSYPSNQESSDTSSTGPIIGVTVSSIIMCLAVVLTVVHVYECLKKRQRPLPCFGQNNEENSARNNDVESHPLNVAERTDADTKGGVD